MTARARDDVGHRLPLVVLAAGRATRYGGLKPLAPVGVGGEAILDILASDAHRAGFGTIVIVIGSETGAAVRYHVAHCWPSEVDVRFAVQAAPRGTADAVRAAATAFDPSSHFAVANADDLPGSDALVLLAAHLAGATATGATAAGATATGALVTFHLGDTIVGTSPVTRGLCRVTGDDTLAAVEERRHVTRHADGRFLADDGTEPAELDPEQPVSMNLWGFSPAIHEVIEAATSGPIDGEVLLPDVVQRLLSAKRGVRIDALRAPGRCIGVTHASDVPLVTAALARDIGRGERPATLWTCLGAR